MAKKKRFPEEAICYEGQPLDGYVLGSIRHHSDEPFLLVHEASGTVVSVTKGTWYLQGKWFSPDEFAKLYELPPEPEPIVEVLPPEPELPPPQEPAEAPVAPEPAPVVEEPLPLSIGPSALDVDQGSMSHNQETP